jgi:DNA helicase HerA-like ATPase
MITLGTSDYRGEIESYGIPDADRLRHLLVLGQTGTGKSSLLVNIAVQDIEQGKSVVFIDPHGSSARTLLDLIPRERTRRTIVFEPARYPLGINLIGSVPPERRHLAASQLVSIFQSTWGEYFKHVQERLLYTSALSLMQAGDEHTIFDIISLLTNSGFRQKIVAKLREEVLIDFWVNEFDARKSEYRMESIEPLLNKVSAFVFPQPVREVVSVRKPKLNLSMIRPLQEIFIADLSGVGEQEAKLLANVLLAKLFLDALREHSATPLYIHTDEVGMLAPGILMPALSRGRAFGLGLTLATQYLAQLSPELQSAIFGNIGSIVTLRVGAEDGDILAPHFAASNISALDLQSLKNFHFYAKLLNNGVAYPPFYMAADLPRIAKDSRQAHIIRNTRIRFG